MVLVARRSGDVLKLNKFFKGGEYGRYRVLRILDHLLDNVFAFKELMGNQVTVVVLEAIQHVRDGVVDRIVRVVADIREVRFIDHVKKFLHKSLIHSRHLS